MLLAPISTPLCDILPFNGVWLLAKGFFYNCSGIVVYVRHWEAKDGYHVAHVLQHKVNVIGERKLDEINK